MKIYIVNQPFMTRKGQFEKDRHTLVIGIEAQALKTAGEYRVYIGKNRKVYWDVSYKEALEIYSKYGENAITKRGDKLVFILPLKFLRQGIAKDPEKEEEKRNRLIIEQQRLV